MCIYSAWVVYTGAVTVGIATTPTYAKIYPVILCFTCSAALYGVIRSRWTRKVWLEYIGTLLMIAGLVGFSVAIIITSFILDEPWRAPSSLLPIIIAVFATLRLINIYVVVKKRHEMAKAIAASQRIAVEVEP